MIIISKIIFLLQIIDGAGELAQWLGAYVSLTEDQFLASPWLDFI